MIGLAGQGEKTEKEIEDTEPCCPKCSEDMPEENCRSVVSREIVSCVEEMLEMYCCKSYSRKNIEDICKIGWEQMSHSSSSLSDLFYYKLFMNKKYIPQREIDEFLWFCVIQYMYKYNNEITKSLVEKNLTSEFVF